MDKKIKQYADARDLTSLKYIFVDSLDVDPTFEQYEESYNYCKSIPGLLEQHMELTPFTYDSAQWTDAYWVNLKVDLEKNFSDRRMSHMREVAKVLMAEKVQRLQRERQETSKPITSPERFTPPTSKPLVTDTPKVRAKVPSEAEQEKELQEERQKLEAENRRIAEEQAAKKRAAAARAAALERENQHFESQRKSESGAFPKKAVGIAVAVVAVVVILFILLK